MNNQEIEKAIEIILYRSSHIPDCDLCSKRAFELAISALEQQLNGGWIPVSEQLPENYGYYLITYQDVGGTVNWMETDYDEDGWNCTCHVIAWRETIEPYKGEDKDEVHS